MSADRDLEDGWVQPFAAGWTSLCAWCPPALLEPDETSELGWNDHPLGADELELVERLEAHMRDVHEIAEPLIVNPWAAARATNAELEAVAGAEPVDELAPAPIDDEGEIRRRLFADESIVPELDAALERAQLDELDQTGCVFQLSPGVPFCGVTPAEYVEIAGVEYALCAEHRWLVGVAELPDVRAALRGRELPEPDPSPVCDRPVVMEGYASVCGAPSGLSWCPFADQHPECPRNR